MFGFLGPVHPRVLSAKFFSPVRGFSYWADRSDRVHVQRIDEPLRDLWLERSRFQFEFLKNVGLTPSTNFLDYGCAHLATAYQVIPFVKNAGCYVGIDVGIRVKAYP